jgi:hypothetical protein
MLAAFNDRNSIAIGTRTQRAAKIDVDDPEDFRIRHRCERVRRGQHAQPRDHDQIVVTST